MLLGLDLGSRHIGLVAAPPVLPLAPVYADTLDVDPKDIDPTIDGLESFLDANPGITALVVEHTVTLWIPADATPQAAQAIAANHEVCARLHERIKVLARARSLPLFTIPWQAWAPRVCPGAKGITDDMTAEGIAGHLLGFTYPFQTQDELDACGALIGHLLGPAKASRSPAKAPPRPVMTAEERVAARRARSARSAARRSHREHAIRAQAATHLGCLCGPGGTPRTSRGRHALSCPAEAAAKARGPTIGAAKAALELPAVPPTPPASPLERHRHAKARRARSR